MGAHVGGRLVAVKTKIKPPSPAMHWRPGDPYAEQRYQAAIEHNLGPTPRRSAFVVPGAPMRRRK